MRGTRDLELEKERIRARMERDRHSFAGCYSSVLDALLQPLPRAVAATGARLLSRLRVVEAIARFQVRLVLPFLVLQAWPLHCE